MKKSIFWLTVAMIVLASAIMLSALSRNIAAGILLSQENEDGRTSIQININTASVEELTIIPGIGEGLAKKIIAHRRQNGPYKAVEDLLQVNGIGSNIYDKIAEYLTVGG